MKEYKKPTVKILTVGEKDDFLAASGDKVKYEIKQDYNDSSPWTNIQLSKENQQQLWDTDE